MYTQNQKGTGLDALTTPDSADLVIMSDVSDAGRAKKTTFSQFAASIITIINTITGSNKVNATAADTTAGVLDSKIELVSANNSVTITKTIQNPGADEKISYDLSAAGGIGGGSGGTKIAIDSTQVSVPTDGTPTDLYTVNIPGGTLETNNAIRIKVIGQRNSSVNFSVVYGGSTILTNMRQSNPGGFEINAVIVADGATNAQKAEGQSLPQPNDTAANSYGTAAVDSTVDQDLVIVGTSTGGGTPSTVEAIIVEKIAGMPSTTLYVTQPILPGASGISPVGSASNTTMYIGMVVVPEAITVTDVSIAVQSVSVAGTLDFSVYSEDGATRLITGTTGTISGVGTVTTTITPVSLAAGKYYFAFNSNGTSDFQVFCVLLDVDIFDISDIGTGSVLSGTLTITAGTPPTSIDPTAITVERYVPLMRFDS